MSPPRLIHLADTDSTMDDARRLAHQLAADPATLATLRRGVLITAEHQNKGRGTQGRPWHSPPGALMGSFVRAVPPETGPTLALRAALHLAELIDRWLADAPSSDTTVRIKWPNDLLIADRKLAGILIERTTTHGGLPLAILGVGINANNPPPDLPPGERPATSLSLHRTAPLDLADAAGQLADALARATDLPHPQLTDDELTALNTRLYARGLHAELRAGPGPPTPAIIDAIEHDGSLRLHIEPHHTPTITQRPGEINWPMRTEPNATRH